MQMNSAGHSCVVDEAHDRLTALLDEKGWAGRHPIVTKKNCGSLVRIDLLRELVDVDLIVVNWVAGNGVCDRPVPS
jgi:hypothetical protein